MVTMRGSIARRQLTIEGTFPKQTIEHLGEDTTSMCATVA